MAYNQIADCEVFDAPPQGKQYATGVQNCIPHRNPSVEPPPFDTRPKIGDIEAALEALQKEREAPLTPPQHDQFIGPYYGECGVVVLEKNFENVIQTVRQVPLVDQPLTLHEAQRRFGMMDEELKWNCYNPKLSEDRLYEHIRPLSDNVQQKGTNL